MDRTRRYSRGDDSFFAGFTFAADQDIGRVVRFYGFSVDTDDPGTTIGQFVTRRCRGVPHVGLRLPIGASELVVLESREGCVTKVGLRLRGLQSKEPSKVIRHTRPRSFETHRVH